MGASFPTLNPGCCCDSSPPLETCNNALDLRLTFFCRCRSSRRSKCLPSYASQSVQPKHRHATKGEEADGWVMYKTGGITTSSPAHTRVASLITTWPAYIVAKESLISWHDRARLLFVCHFVIGYEQRKLQKISIAQSRQPRCAVRPM